MSDERLLARAAALVARGWCRKAPAQDWRGRPVDPRSDRALRWSPLGALERAWAESPETPRDVFEAARASLALATGGRPDEWNDAPWRTKWHAVSALRRARDYLPQAREEVRAETAPSAAASRRAR